MGKAVWDDSHREELLDRIASGEQSLAAICRSDDMPSLRTVYNWIEADEEFAARFRARKDMGVRAMVDDCLAIADEPVTEQLEVQNKRVRIDTRLRLAGKWLHKEFGEKIDVNSTSEVTHKHDLDNLSDKELEQLEGILAKSERSEVSDGAKEPSSLH